jgi:hypothetical protein
VLVSVVLELDAHHLRHHLRMVSVPALLEPAWLELAWLG